MKKKTALASGIALLIILCMMLPSVQTFAVSMLSVFRVSDTKKITITMTDLEEMAGKVSDIPKEVKEEWASRRERLKNDAYEYHLNYPYKRPESKNLSSIYEFNGFDMELPDDLKDQQPNITTIDAQTIPITIDTEQINELLKSLGVESTMGSSYNGKIITLHLPAVAALEYEDLLLVATQGIYVEDKEGIIDKLWSKFLELPILTENIRSQLSAIDPKKQDVYVPVIAGVGRETAIGNNTGYIYTIQDLIQSFPSVKDIMDQETSNDLPENASVLVFTKNGVLYCLAGNKTDSELTKIARSMH